jgi:hypothetical protein
MLDAGCWMLDAGCRLYLVRLSRILTVTGNKTGSVNVNPNGMTM